MKFNSFALFLLSLAWFVPHIAQADVPEYSIVIENHQFTPAELEIPKETKVKLVIENRDSTPEEFESYELNREKIVGAKSKIMLFVGPLDPGEYAFFGEFNPKTAQGKLIVKE